MDQFIRSHVKALQTGPARPPKPVTCLRVHRLAARSIAAHAGVAADDLVVFVDGGPASRAEPKLYKKRANKRLYTFYSPSRSEQVELATTGIEIGVELEPTSEAIQARYKPEEGDFESLEQLWKNRAHTPLLELATATLAHRDMRETPALVLAGAAQWETGRHADGMALIEEYLQRYSRKWVMVYAAIGMHYRGLEQLRLGDPVDAVYQLQDSFSYEALDRTADKLAELTGERPPMRVPKWEGQRFPVRYTLPRIEEDGRPVSLADTLAAMDADKVLVVCLLATYRSNGPYGEFLQRWQNYAAWFAPFLQGLHVITMAPNRYSDADQAWHYQMEDVARQAGRPFVLLYDETGDAHTPLGLDRSPMIFVLDRPGTVLYEGALDPVDWWDTLAKISAS